MTLAVLGQIAQRFHQPTVSCRLLERNSCACAPAAIPESQFLCRSSAAKGRRRVPLCCQFTTTSLNTPYRKGRIIVHVCELHPCTRQSVSVQCTRRGGSSSNDTAHHEQTLNQLHPSIRMKVSSESRRRAAATVHEEKPLNNRSISTTTLLLSPFVHAASLAEVIVTVRFDGCNCSLCRRMNRLWGETIGYYPGYEEQ